MDELQKDVKYFTRLWQQELSRREKAEAALADLVAAAEPFKNEPTLIGHATRIVASTEGNSFQHTLIKSRGEIRNLAVAVERARKVMKEEK